MSIPVNIAEECGRVKIRGDLRLSYIAFGSVCELSRSLIIVHAQAEPFF